LQYEICHAFERCGENKVQGHTLKIHSKECPCLTQQEVGLCSIRYALRFDKIASRPEGLFTIKNMGIGRGGRFKAAALIGTADSGFPTRKDWEVEKPWQKKLQAM
jgi:hypothetical protein